MNDYDYLTKSLPTTSDLYRLHTEVKALEKVIHDYIKGNETEENFKAARARINTLAVLSRAAANRLKKHSDKNRLRVVK